MEPLTLDTAALAELAEDLGEEFAPFVARFLDAAPAALDAVDAALGRGAPDAAAARAHELKGSAGYLGAGALAACLGELQHVAERGEPDRARQLAARARALLGEVSPMLRANSGRD